MVLSRRGFFFFFFGHLAYIFKSLFYQLYNGDIDSIDFRGW